MSGSNVRSAAVTIGVAAAALFALASWLKPEAATHSAATKPTIAEKAPVASASAASTDTAVAAAGPAIEPAAAPAPTESADGGVRALLVPRRETTVAAGMFGRIDMIANALGSVVRAGEPLVRFDCREAQARLDIASAELTAAKESHEAKIRLQGLQSAGEVEVNLAAAAREKAKAALALATVQVQSCTVLAPFPGRVAKVHAKPFQTVNAGQPLLDFVSAEAPRVKANVPSGWLRWLRNGAPFDVRVDETAHTYKARVSAINARVDAVSQTIEIEAELVNPGPALLAGMSGLAMFPAR